MKMSSREVEIAKTAYNILFKSLKYDEKAYDDQDKIATYLKGLPSSFTQNGMLQTLAFMRAKNREIYDEINKVLGKNHSKDLIKQITSKNDFKEYINLQKESIELAIKLKQIAVAFQKPKPKKGKD